MKKGIIGILIGLIIFTGCLNFAYAENTNIQTVEYYEDGSYLITTLTQNYIVGIGLLSTRSSKTETKKGHYYDSNGAIVWTASITASFTYNGTTASCTTVSKSQTIYNNSWKCTSSSCYKSGATATGDFTFKHYVLGIPNKTINRTLTLTCDKNGNIT